MPWLYRLQTRAGLTGPEGTAAVVLVLALAGGLAAQRYHAAAAPVALDFYAAADAAFVAASQAGPAAAPLLAVAAGRPEAPEPSATDSAAEASAETWAVAPEASGDAADAIVETSSARSSGRKPPPVRTNLNTASAEELQRLPRIGPALAGRIVEYRRQHGRFGSAAELNEVRGIGDKTMERLAPWVHV